MMSIFTTLRAFSAAVADVADPTAASAFVSLGPIARYGVIEVCYRDGAVANSPTSVTLGIWRKITDPLGTVSLDRIASVTIDADDIARPLPTVVNAYGAEFYPTIESFAGGSSPTLTMTVQARFVEVVPA
jgi:hypothetical protein